MNKTLITLETLSQTTEIWGLQDKFSWMIIPRNVSSCTRAIKELASFLSSVLLLMIKWCHNIVKVLWMYEPQASGSTTNFSIIVKMFISEELIRLHHGWKMMNFDLAEWTVSLLALNQEETWESSRWPSHYDKERYLYHQQREL